LGSIPLVAVVVPVHNREGTVLRAVESVLNQSFTDFEVLVVDDGSTDRTAAVVSACEDPRVRLLRHRANRGAAAARNTGIRAARSELIAFLDSDDEWIADKLERQIDCLKNAPPDVLMCCTGYWSVRMRSHEVLPRIPRYRRSWRHALRGGCNLSPGSTALVRREAFERHGLFDERLRRLEDWDWLLRYSAVNDLIVVEALLARIHVAERMNAVPVDEAASVMLAKHGAAMRRQGYWTGAQFRAAMLLEQGATCFYAGRYLRAVACLAESLARYPLKPAAFFRQLMRRAILIARSSNALEHRKHEHEEIFPSLASKGVLIPRASKRKV
jgi:glycosyltransferase involved in cell wall biosynthesis